MVNAKELKPLSLQFSFFTPELVFSGNKILTHIASKFGHYFDGEPTFLPLPQDLPPDIPRITLQSEAQTYKVEIAVSRVNMYKFFQKARDKSVDEFLKLCLDFSKEYVGCTNSQIGRLAVVFLKFLETETPGLDLAKHFCKEKWITSPSIPPQKFEIHFYHRTVHEGFNINCWFRCKTGILNNNKNIILIEQDINTLTEELLKKHFSFGEIEKFLSVALEKQESLLSSYLP